MYEDYWFEFGILKNVNSTRKKFYFEHDFNMDHIHLFSQVMTNNDVDPVIVRYDFLSDIYSEIYLDEDTCYDSEKIHEGHEDVGYLGVGKHYFFY